MMKKSDPPVKCKDCRLANRQRMRDELNQEAVMIEGEVGDEAVPVNPEDQQDA
jgi:hypothetical protein